MILSTPAPPPRAEVVVDLSDEPVLGPRERMLWASKALALGLEYVGADFRFRPPAYLPAPSIPSLAVVGTGKRIGKTAVTGHLARLFAQRGDVVVVSMGRGGPAEPELVQVAPTLAQLLEISRAGGHAASDYLETAALAGVPTIGCRRAGGGLAGDVLTSNVRRDIDCYRNLFADGCWMVIDDYISATNKAGPTREHVDELTAQGRLQPLGFYGWGTWVGRWMSVL